MTTTPDAGAGITRYTTIAAAAAVVTAAAGAAGYWLVMGPVADRMISPDCVGDCVFDSSFVGEAIIGMVLMGVAQLLVAAAVVGVAGVLIGLLLVQRWPQRPAARVAGGLLVLAPPAGVTAATAAIAFLHLTA